VAKRAASTAVRAGHPTAASLAAGVSPLHQRAREELARDAIRIERMLRGSLVRDLMAYSVDQRTRQQLGAAVVSLLLRNYLADLPAVDQPVWLESIIKGVLI
jgi:hypothetical protein